ncbi:tRNA (cytosine(72)-C(5))-methyltransferase NSUN6 [Frankliniella fusca]|uniref:tRNA (Cytosine(72)-C(5))-methyltransferase NSUN6 n=1 Tax=Frankliniella fusca TaxID=407009 RepID=A0AAE1L7I9_9NEOP|nr:tRNA (cytosine(72)-C(5))-methyltransferase NSUN6 [Frankliniella fusca]
MPDTTGSTADTPAAAAAAAQAPPADTPGPQGDAPQVDTTWVCLDVSGSIRGGTIYPKWVMEDVQKIETATAATRWILWGSAGEYKKTCEEVVEYLADEDQTLGGTDPHCFMELLPVEGVIDLHVYTDGEIGEDDVHNARQELHDNHPNLKVRTVTIVYVNKNLDSMNVGLSAIFDGHVLEVHRTRVYDGTKLHQFEAKPLGTAVTFVDILDKYLVLGKTEEEMTQGIHYLSQRFANADAKTRQEIRRAVRERADAVNREHRMQTLTPEQEAGMIADLDAGRWMNARKPFIGHAVSDEVKLMQAYTQKFLNETKDGRALIRISAYAPLVIKDGKKKDEAVFDVSEDVLLDHIMYLGLGKEAVIVLPVTVPEPTYGRRGRRLLKTHVQCGLSFEGKINYDNTFSLHTLFQLRDQQAQDGVGDVIPGAAVPVLDQLAGRGVQYEPAPEPETLSSGAHSFGVNPFTRQEMECILLIPASPESLDASRLAEIDAWNANMLSRFVRSGRSMPSVALLLSLLLERAFLQWEDAPRAEDRAEAERLKAVCRRYVGRMATPLTFTVGLPVIIEGSFQLAARLACAVLQGALDPKLPLDVLTQFWYTITDAEEAAKVWDCLRVYAGLPENTPFPAVHHKTLRALQDGAQYIKSARDLKLREKKGRGYSIRMYLKRLDQLHAAGCHPQRLRAEEKAVRLDLFGVPVSEPMLCVHGVDVDECKALPDQDVDVICTQTCRPTLLNKKTMDMWYVGQPEDPSDLAAESFHKAMWQLVRKRTKAKKPRHDAFPPEEAVFLKFVANRLRALSLEKSDGGRLLPTVPCARLAQDVSLTYSAYVNLVAAYPTMNRKRFMKALRVKREVCAFGDCCEYIRSAVNESQRAWIDTHATHLEVAGDRDVLSGKASYRQAA